MKKQRTVTRILQACLLVGITAVFTLASPAHAQDSGDPPPATTPYTSVTMSAGINMPHQGNEKITGQAWGDYDLDGWLDLYLTDFAGANVLYRNNGDGTFAPSPLSSQVALPDARSGGAIFADYDNDGWSDLYVVNWGANTLFHNVNGQRFEDVTSSAGVGETANGKTASWGDYDQDGYLDLYVANWACYPECGRPSEGDRDRLYHNNGDGTFTDATNFLPGSTRGAGFVASFLDYDNDGDPDIYLVNDEFINPIGNILWRNDGPGCDGWCFSNVSLESGANTQVMGMGLATADYDRDGDLDFYFSNGGPMTLLQNQGNGTFVDVAAAAGVDFPAIGWGAAFFDYDNDGWNDLYLAVMEPIDQETAANPLFRNDGDGTFTNLGVNSGAADSGATIGVAYADYDNDGWLDIVTGNYDSQYNLYHNQMGTASTNNWVAFNLIGAGPVNRDAIGARIHLLDNQGRVQMQEVVNGSSLGAGNSLRLHFGLGNAVVDMVQITWPDGTFQIAKGLSHNQFHTLTYGVDPAAPLTPTPITSQQTNPTSNSSRVGWNLWVGILWLLVLAAAVILALVLYLYWQAHNQIH